MEGTVLIASVFCNIWESPEQHPGKMRHLVVLNGRFEQSAVTMAEVRQTKAYTASVHLKVHAEGAQTNDVARIVAGYGLVDLHLDAVCPALGRETSTVCTISGSEIVMQV